MIRRKEQEQPDKQVEQIRAALTEYQKAHPKARIDVRRRHPVIIHIRIIDPDFEGTDWFDREPEVWNLLEQLPEETVADISVLLLLTPEEAEKSIASYEFDHPISSPL